MFVGKRHSQWLNFLFATDQKAMVFLSGRFIEYQFQRKVQVQEGYLNLAFKTSVTDSIIFQLRGLRNAHITLVMQAGVLKLLYNFSPDETDFKSIELKHPTAMGKFSDNQRHAIRIHHKKNQMYTYVLDDNSNPISAVRNISGPTIETAPFPEPAFLSVGKYRLSVPSIPTTFAGCISGFRYQYLPQNAQVGVNIDMQSLLVTKNTNLITSPTPPVNGSCGPSLPIPPPLPPIIEPQQFKFRNPVVTVAPIGSKFTFAKIVVVIIIIVLAILAIILLFITLNCIAKYRRKYQKKEKDLQLILNEEPTSTAPTSKSNRQFEPVSEPEPAMPLTKMEPVRTDTKQAYPPQPSYEPGGISYAPKPQPAVSSAPARDDDDDDDDGFFL